MISPRQLLPDTVANLRDLGGLRTGDGMIVRPRRLLRSSALVGLDSRSAAKLTELIGVATYFDLRTDHEIDRDGDPAAMVALGWQWFRLPIQDSTDSDTADRYSRTVPDYVATARTIAGRLDGRPGVVCCSLGKDRTGLVIALLLHWLDVSEQEIGVDFELSNTCIAFGHHLLPSRWQDPQRTIHRVTAEDCIGALTTADDIVSPTQFVRLRALLLTGPAGDAPERLSNRETVLSRRELTSWSSRGARSSNSFGTLPSDLRATS